jgi:hypothetical protein
MKRLLALLLLLSFAFCCPLFSACDQTPGDVVIGGDELHPNENHKPSAPSDGGEGDVGGDNGGEGETPPEIEEPSGGIGKNEPVDLPFVPV